MSAARRIATILTLTALAAVAGDRARVGGRLVMAPVARADASPLEGFELFGWVSPPVVETTPARYAEMAGVRFTLALPVLSDSGRREDNLARLEVAAANGIRCLLWDQRFERFLTLDIGSPAGAALLDSICSDYEHHPGFFGYYLGDEPPQVQFAFLARLFDALRARDPAHPAWNNLLGRGTFPSRDAWIAYTRAYLDTVRPAVLSNDHYDFTRAGDVGLFLENVTGLRALASAYGLPFWAIVLLIEHGPYRALTEGELRWQVSTLLAYGARGVGYFTYWTPSPDTAQDWQPAVIALDGTRTHWYGTLERFDPHVRAAGETLAGLTWLATAHANGAPAGTVAFAPDEAIAAVEGRAVLGTFVDGAGLRHVLVANPDSLAARTVTLTLRSTRPVSRLAEAPGRWTSVVPEPAPGGARLALDLAAGDFALLRLDAFASLDAGTGPGLVVAPNPAGGETRFVLARLGGRARLEILDAAGRRVWSHAPAWDEGTVRWRGEREDGVGTAPAGLYFVRVENPAGVSVRRLTWLGAR